ncbi:stage II sporulation protein M [Methanobrevibacter sp.]|uniref:stage II sporulation protein M n=1 Tax=Methanobrevibacter sp. TaxID=66852 RepID=UPI0038903403
MISEIKLAFRQNKFAIILSAAILLISLVLGYVLEPYLHSFLNPVVEDLTQKVESGVIQLTFEDIFLNNIQIVFQMFVYGIALCFSVIVLSFNGFFVGYYVAGSDNLFFTLLLIVPHGIFEFSSCILACASGLVLFNFIYRFLKSLWNQKEDSVVQSLKNAFGESSVKLKQAIIILAIASILMVIAGFIEVYLTIPIANFIVNLFI